MRYKELGKSVRDPRGHETKGARRTEPEPEEHRPSLFCPTPSGQPVLEPVAELSMRIIVGVLAALLSEGWTDRDQRGPVSTNRSESRETKGLTRDGRDKREDQHPDDARPLQDPSDPRNFERERKRAKLVPPEEKGNRARVSPIDRRAGPGWGLTCRR